MKKTKYLYLTLITILLIGISSCDTTDLELSDNPNSLTPESANPNFILNQIQLDLTNLFGRVADNSMRLTRSLYMFDAYPGTVNNTTLNNIWTLAYRINNNRILISNLADNDSSLTKQRALAKLISAYTFVTLTDLAGGVPYSEAGQPNIFINPSLDNDEDLYNTMFDLIDSAISDLNDGVSSTITQDLYYSGDLSKWVKFANTLKLKMYNQIRVIDPVAASNGISTLLTQDDLIEDMSDDFQFQYTANQSPAESRHRYFTNPYLGGGASVTLYMNNGFMSLLKDSHAVTDPRLRYYFYRQTLSDPDPTAGELPCTTLVSECYIGDGYWGRIHAASDGVPADNLARTIYGVYPGGGAFDNDNDLPGTLNQGKGGAGINPIFLSSFTKFIKAEAALTLGTSGNPRLLLEEGVTNSIQKVMNFGSSDAGSFEPSATDVSNYIQVVMDDYDAATDDNGRLDIVLREYYIAGYGNGIEAYNAYRKTGLPSVLQDPLSPSPFPRLFILPTNETLNNPNVNQNSLLDQVFWDNNPANFIN